MRVALRTIAGIVISNVSFPKYLEEEISANDKSCDLILPYLIQSIKQLERSRSDFIVLPCNTLHLLLPKLRKETNIPILDMVESVCKCIKNNYKKIGILSTNKTRKERLYDNNLNGVEVIYPDYEDQRELSNIIIKIIRGTSDARDNSFLRDLVNKMIDLGAEKVLLACTDLGNLIKDDRVIDSVDILIDDVRKEF